MHQLSVAVLKEQKDVVVLDTDPQQSVEVFLNIRGETDLPTFPLFNRTGLTLLQSPFTLDFVPYKMAQND
ncbi:hypothetical protein NHP190012_16510 (plasmid) [Helicobacter sp. NHP19-012]|uniref:Uncharacterized protein n=1 Tax=Helicobacter gastrofelis TaxID=2849642 RepID=A0ABN6IBD1_9HELI|nr:hypothetical protein NHP190012_16510 [Helicobacter sp. NHP19-012]GMB96983.1 hypothetical protein NHP22001_15750 [Helicobacter sp. NHP22-001]